MKKKVFALTLCLALCALLALPAFAGEYSTAASSYGYVIDEADLLTDSEEAQLSATLQDLSRRHGCDIIVYAANTMQGYYEARLFAADCFEQWGYGQGSNRDGIILMLSMEDRDYGIATHGFCIPAFTDAGQDYMIEQMSDNLSDNEFNAAFTQYADLCDELLAQYEGGEAYDIGSTAYEDNSKPNPVVVVVICLALGIVIGFIGVGIMKSKLKSVRPQGSANSYVRPGSMNVTRSMDIFIGRSVSRTEKPRNNSSGGGSSTFSSSSGSTFGGSSGKF